MSYYYTYAYLRKGDRTPYYIGKGRGKRVYDSSHSVKVPDDKDRIIFLKQNLTEEEAFNHEKYMIAVFGRKDLETGILRNMTDGGEGRSGSKHSEETKQKIRNANVNIPEERRKKMSEKAKGRTHSEETKQKMSEKAKGRTHSEETKQKIRNANVNIPEERRKKMSEKAKGRTHSEETKEKIRQFALNRKNKEHKTLVENLEAL